MAKDNTEYYCVAVRRNYESIWRFIGKYNTPEAAQAALEEKRAYTGSFNYDNAELRVVSRSQAKKEFGSDWEYYPIGSKPPAKATHKTDEGGEKAKKPVRKTTRKAKSSEAE